MRYRTAASLSFLSRRAVHRERAYRQILVLAVAALVVFSMLPLFGVPQTIRLIFIEKYQFGASG